MKTMPAGCRQAGVEIYRPGETPDEIRQDDEPVFASIADGLHHGWLLGLTGIGLSAAQYGDNYPSGEFNNPRITVTGDSAAASVLFTHTVCQVPLYFWMRRDRNRWIITRTEWGDG